MALLAEPQFRMEILLIEDNPADARLVSMALKGFDIEHHLRIVTDGQLAMDFLQREGDYRDAPRPDVIILDWKLPFHDGGDILRVIRQDPVLRDTPVAVVTGVYSQELTRENGRDGANLYVEKPVTLDRFSFVMQCLMQALRKRGENPPSGFSPEN